MRGDRVSVRAADFEGAVGEVDLHVASEVLFEVGLLLGGLERIAEPPEAVGRKQLLLGEVDIGSDNQMCLDEFANLVFFDTSRGVVRRSVLGNCGPIPGLQASQPSLRSLALQSLPERGNWDSAYPIDKGICEHVIVGGQLRQGQRVLLCTAGCAGHLGHIGRCAAGNKCRAGRGGVVRRSGQIRAIQQTSSCVQSKEWALVAKCVGTSE